MQSVNATNQLIAQSQQLILDFISLYNNLCTLDFVLQITTKIKIYN